MAGLTKPVAVLLMGDAPDCIRERCGNFDDMFIRTANLVGIPHTVVRVAEGEVPDAPSAYAASIVTGSLAMVTDEEPWSLRMEDWLRQAVAADVPVLAVCYGHQLLAKALGGTVAYHPRGPETGTLDIFLTDAAEGDPLTAGVSGSFRANLAHSQTVTALPAGARVLAYSHHDPHQLVRYGENIWSVQFHPEFDVRAMAVWIDYAKEHAPDQPVAEPAEETPRAAAVLRRFVERFTTAPTLRRIRPQGVR